MSTFLDRIAPYLPSRLILATLADPRVPDGPIAEHLPGAVLFADIAGFTRLTQDLVRSGAEGPEELAWLLNTYFGRIVSLVREQGGEVVKFAGDAITVIFDATEEPIGHAVRRAKQTADAILTAESSLSGLQTSIGPVSLRVKIGIGIGQVVAMRVGGVLGRWEYVIGGDAVRQAIRAIHRPERGEILLSSEVSRAICPHPVPSYSSKQADLATALCPAQVARTLSSYLPRPLLQWLHAGLHEWMAGFHPMSVLFFGVQGVPESDEQEESVAHHVLKMVLRETHRFEGTLARMAVDDKGLTSLILFGAPPYTHEDDPARAVRCAMNLRARFSSVAADSNSPVGAQKSIRIGVATGPLFAGPIGGDDRREYTVMGDAVNLAARLMERADPGEILCDYETYYSSRSWWAFETLAPVRIRGRAGLFRVYRPMDKPIDSVEAPSGLMGISRRSIWGQSRLVGREAELARLDAAMSAVVDGGNRLLIIEGEAGIGKSRLVAEMTRLARESGLAWLMGAGHSVEQQTPYRAWRDVFSFYFGLDTMSTQRERSSHNSRAMNAHLQALVDEVAPEWSPYVPLLNDVLGKGLPEGEATEKLEPVQRRTHLAAFLLGLLQAWMRDRPLILVFEDAQWLDDRSWELVSQAVALFCREDGSTCQSAHGRGSVLLALVTRPLFQQNPASDRLNRIRALTPCETISLQPLDRSEIVELVSERFGLAENELPTSMVELVCERSQGNPFYAEQVAFALRDQGLIRVQPAASRRAGGASHLVLCGDFSSAKGMLPWTVQGLVLSRVAHLPPEHQLILKVASVIGPQFSFDVLHRALRRHFSISTAQLHQHLQELAALDLTSLSVAGPRPVHVFKHIITRDVVYQALLFHQRRVLHQSVAEALAEVVSVEGMPAPTLLTYHWEQAAEPGKA